MRVLLDCDGVVADWTKAVAAVVRKHGGEMDTTKWFKRNDLPEQIRNKVMYEIGAAGFNSTFEVIKGSKEAIKLLRKLGHEVHFVTSMWDCPTWTYDRNVWLRYHKLANAPDGVTYEKNKYISSGDFFVDDKIKNVEEWKAAWPNGVAILWAQPWNADYKGSLLRFNDWDRLVNMVETMGERIAA